MDGDGDIDAVHGGWDDTVIKWHENDGSNVNFVTHIVDTLGERSIVALEDLDGDNDVDIIATCQIPSAVVWYENDGNQNFTKLVISNSNSRPRIVIPFDLDKDGDIDLATANYADNVIWYENDGQQDFATHRIPSSPTANTIYVVDLDDDEDWDIITGDPDQNHSSSRVGWLENDGAMNFGYHNITYNLLWSSSVWADDLDGDGDKDVLFSSLYDDKVAWYESNLSSATSVENNTTGPSEFGLLQNYPNPFNPTTIINYRLSAASKVELRVFNTAGQEIRTLLSSEQAAGSHQVHWSGRDAQGNPVPSGVYLYQLRTGSVLQTRKMLLMR